MVWSQFSIKTLGIHFANSALDNTNWDKINHSLSNKWIFGTTLFEMKKKNFKTNAFIQIWVIGQIYTIPKFIKKGNLRKQYKIFSGMRKIRPSRQLAQLSVWKVKLSILVIDTQLKIIKPINALWKGLMLYRLNLKLNSN